MSLKAKDWSKVETFSDFSGGVNLNDPALSLRNNQVVDCINAKFPAQGVERLPGAVNLTTQGAIDGLMRGQFTHGEVDGTQHLYEVHGSKLYEVNKSTGALTELYEFTGNGEAWGASSHGVFYCSNGSGMCKVEGSTAYQVGIDAPTGVTAAESPGNGDLQAGVYKLYVGYARKVGGDNVLYSVGQYLEVTLNVVGGIQLSNFTNSPDGQVNNKVVWMTYEGLETPYFWYETDDNVTVTFVFGNAIPDNELLTYGANASQNYQPPNLDFIIVSDKRVFGIKNNLLYYSQKGYNQYDLDKWPLNNVLTMPYRGTGLFTTGKHLCFNTEQNGVIVQPNSDVSAKLEHFEKKTSFRYMRTVDEWDGNKIGMTSDRIGIFSKETFTFVPFDFGYNIRPILDRVWANDASDHRPCGKVHRRENRIEYMLSVMDTNVNSTNNNRTLYLNLSRTVYVDVDQNKAPWEIGGRGANYISIDTDNTLFMGQSFVGSSTIYKENLNASTEIGIYGDDGEYITTATPMEMYFITKTITENMFTNTSIENIRALFQATSPVNLLVSMVDDPGKTIDQETSTEATGQSLWDVMFWDDDSWSAESLQQYEFKGDMGVNGFIWNLKISQVANDIDFEMNRISVLIKLETGNGI